MKAVNTSALGVVIVYFWGLIAQSKGFPEMTGEVAAATGPVAMGVWLWLKQFTDKIVD